MPEMPHHSSGQNQHLGLRKLEKKGILKGLLFAECENFIGRLRKALRLYALFYREESGNDAPKVRRRRIKGGEGL